MPQEYKKDYIPEALEGQKKKKYLNYRAKNVLKKIMAENVPNLGGKKEIQIYIFKDQSKPQTR